MASSGYTTLQLYHSNVPSAVPVAANLVSGELSINTADGVLYYKDAAGNVASIRGSSGSNSGFSGYSGYSGVSGFSGYSGYSGRSGAPGGSSGYSGYSGYSSFSGYSGQSGQSGYSGTGVPAAGTAGNILISNGSSFISQSPVTAGFALLDKNQTFTGTNNYSSTASITATGTNAGNQRIGVTYSTYSSGLSATSLQLAGAGVGILFDTTTNTIGFLNGFGGGSGTYLSLTPISGAIGLNNNTLYTSAVDAYKGGSSTAWIATSDIRLKSNIQDYTKGLDLLNQIKPRTWVYNGKGGSTQGAEGLGVVADEIEQVLPSVIRTIPGKLNPEDTETTEIKHVDTTEITWLLVNAVKELAAEIATLKANK
jgi:hypothetical protein